VQTISREWLTFVIVGAGATGLELAGALAEIAKETLKHDFRRINPTEARIILMEGGDRVLAFSFQDSAAAKGKTSYYYVRGQQTDGQIVWVSPMWVTLQ